MTNFRLIAAAALSLVLATPAIAMQHHNYHPHFGQVVPDDLPVQDALRLGYGTGCRTYPSGYGGLYGDGLYPGSVYDNCPHLDLAPTTPFN
jgi:hypothetical protein